jgi:hypothetical protein
MRSENNSPQRNVDHRTRSELDQRLRPAGTHTAQIPLDSPPPFAKIAQLTDVHS